MDVQILVALIGAGGIALAACLGAIGYLLRGQIESKRSARQVLYYLLEIRYAVNTGLIDPDLMYRHYLDDILAAFAGRGVNANREEVELLVGSVVHQHFIDLTQTMEIELDENLLAAYDEALLEFSQINPVLAYRLRGKERLKELATLSSRYSSTVEDKVLPSLPVWTDSGKKALIDFSKSNRRDTLDEMFETFNDDILSVARSCSIFDYLKCRRALRRMGKAELRIDKSELQSMIDQYLVIASAEAPRHIPDPS